MPGFKLRSTIDLSNAPCPCNVALLVLAVKISHILSNEPCPSQCWPIGTHLYLALRDVALLVLAVKINRIFIQRTLLLAMLAYWLSL